MFDVTVGTELGSPVYLDSKGKVVQFPPFSVGKSSEISSENVKASKASRRAVRSALQCGNWSKLDEI